MAVPFRIYWKSKDPLAETGTDSAYKFEGARKDGGVRPVLGWSVHLLRLSSGAVERLPLRWVCVYLWTRRVHGRLEAETIV